MPSIPVGRTVLIAGVAALVFAGFLGLTPRLTGSGPENAAPTVIGAGLPSLSDPVDTAPAEPLDIEVQIVDPESASPSLPPTTSVTTLAIDPGRAGFIEMGVQANGPRQAEGAVIAVEGDEIEWRFRVENIGGQELWGVYVFLELHGPALCEARNLKPGEMTHCWIATPAVEGTHGAQAWATAWTTEHIVSDQITYTFTVTL